MGYSAAHAKFIAREWVAYQDVFSLQALTSVGNANLPMYCSGLETPVGGKFFMSCHYGSYPHVVEAIGKRAKDNTVYVLIGSEGENLKTLLEQRARETNITLHFLDGGFGMLKRVKQALANDYPVFVEIDVPWGLVHECNMEFPFVGGRLKAKDALFRMIERLAVPKNFILSMVGKEGVAIINYGDLNQSQCFSIFADAVRNSPQQYERLFQMHNYFVPEQESKVAIIWQGQQGQYIVHASDMKAWATQLPIMQSENVKEAIENVIGRSVSDVVSL